MRLLDVGFLRFSSVPSLGLPMAEAAERVGDRALQISCRIEDLKLIVACHNCDLDALNELIRDGADPGCIGPDYRTPLHIAAENGWYVGVEALISQAIELDFNSRDRWGTTPLQAALRGHHFQVAHLLREKGSTTSEVAALRQSRSVFPRSRSYGSLAHANLDPLSGRTGYDPRARLQDSLATLRRTGREAGRRLAQLTPQQAGAMFKAGKRTLGARFQRTPSVPSPLTRAALGTGNAIPATVPIPPLAPGESYSGAGLGSVDGIDMLANSQDWGTLKARAVAELGAGRGGSAGGTITRAGYDAAEGTMEVEGTTQLPADAVSSANTPADAATDGKSEQNSMAVDELIDRSLLRKALIALSLPFVYLLLSQGTLWSVLFIITCTVYVTGLAAVLVVQVAVTPPWYRPTSVTDGLTTEALPAYWAGVVGNPRSDLGMAYEDVQFKSQGGRVTLRGWWVPLKPHTKRRTVLVFVHGGGRDRRAWLRHLRVFRGEYLGALLFDLSEHGISDGAGRGLAFGVREKLDVLAAVEYVRATYSPDKVVVLGTSLGGASVLMAAADDARNKMGLIDVVIAENPFVRSTTLLRFHLYQLLKPYVNFKLRHTQAIFGGFSALVTLIARARIGTLFRGDIEAIDVVKHVTQPTLLMHGTGDEVVPWEHSRDLYEACGATRKDLWLAENTAHCMLYDTFPLEFQTRVVGFMEEALHELTNSTPGTPVRQVFANAPRSASPPSVRGEGSSPSNTVAISKKVAVDTGVGMVGCPSGSAAPSTVALDEEDSVMLRSCRVRAKELHERQMSSTPPSKLAPTVSVGGSFTDFVTAPRAQSLD